MVKPAAFACPPPPSAVANFETSIFFRVVRSDPLIFPSSVSLRINVTAQSATELRKFASPAISFLVT